jgi:hypothetical protein
MMYATLLDALDTLARKQDKPWCCNITSSSPPFLAGTPTLGLLDNGKGSWYALAEKIIETLLTQKSRGGRGGSRGMKRGRMDMTAVFEIAGAIPTE